jgi:hypothetical protein
MKMDFFSAWISFLLIPVAVELLLPLKKKKNKFINFSIKSKGLLTKKQLINFSLELGLFKRLNQRRKYQ